MEIGETHHFGETLKWRIKKGFDHYKFHQFLWQLFFWQEICLPRIANCCSELVCLWSPTLSVFSLQVPRKTHPPKKKITSGHVQIHSISHWFRLWPVGLAAGSTRKGERFTKCCRKWGEVDGGKMTCCISWRYCWWFRNSQQQPPGIVRINHVNNGMTYQPQLMQDFFHQQYVEMGLVQTEIKAQLWHQSGINFWYVQLGCFAGNAASLRYCWWKTSPTTTLFPRGIFTISTDDRRISEPSTVRWNDRVFGGFLLTSLSGDSLAGCLAGCNETLMNEFGSWVVTSWPWLFMLYKKGMKSHPVIYRDYFISQGFRVPFVNQPGFNGSCHKTGFFDHLRLQNGSERWNAWLQQPQLSGMLWLEISWKTWYSCWLTFFFRKMGWKKKSQQK